MTVNNNAIVNICQGRGEFIHATSREQITMEKGKLMDVIRLITAISFLFKTK